MAAEVIFYLPDDFGGAEAGNKLVDRLADLIRQKTLTIVFPSGVTVGTVKAFFILMCQRHEDFQTYLLAAPTMAAVFFRGNVIKIETKDSYEHGQQPNDIPFSVRSRG